MSTDRIKQFITAHKCRKGNYSAPEVKMEDNGLVIAGPRKKHTYRVHFGMAFVTEDNKQVCGFVSCRDYLHDEIRTAIRGGKRIDEDGHPYYPKKGDPEICLDRLKILFSVTPKYLDKFKTGMKIINDMEDFAGIEKSTAEIVHIDKKGKGEDTYILVRGDKCYMDVPHLLSVLTLVLRFTTMNPEFKYNRIGDLTGAYKKLDKEGQVQKDNHLMGPSHKYMHIIMKERQVLFGGKTPTELFPHDIGYGFHSKGGIKELCECNSPNKDVNKKIKAIKDSMVIAKESKS